MLDCLDSCPQGFQAIIVLDGNPLLREHRARVDAVVDDEDRDARLARAGCERVLERRPAGKAGSSDGCTLIT